MNTITEADIEYNLKKTTKNRIYKSVNDIITSSWENISPGWPLNNMIAVNPISGLENIEFSQALKQSKAYFQQKNMPDKMQEINRLSIKWLQAFFDDGQATIPMPNRNLGLFKSTLSMIKYDIKLTVENKKKLSLITNEINNIYVLISKLLSSFDIKHHDYEIFITLLLTTLPGWASYVKYKTDWEHAEDININSPITKVDYIAFRLMITYLLWPEAKNLLDWHKLALKSANTFELYQQIQHNEYLFQQDLLKKISANSTFNKSECTPLAQFVFCIDVRSEPFRRSIESQGNFETFGFAGFFGLPISIENRETKEKHSSCPVLLKPECNIIAEVEGNPSSSNRTYKKNEFYKIIYQSLKYNVVTPFILVEIMGIISGAWMTIKSCFPSFLSFFLKTQNKYSSQKKLNLNIEEISLPKQVDFAFNMLKMIGLVNNFAQIIILCGHGSTTENNAYSSSLDCGACGGRSGGPNAYIMAKILNCPQVRNKLKIYKINIPENTFFFSAEHNTTTDELSLYEQPSNKIKNKINYIKVILKNAQRINTSNRMKNLDLPASDDNAVNKALSHSKDWAQVRPEWGLAKNAGFIIGPRSISKEFNLEGRVFLHSYDWEIDNNGALLNSILSAPMIVAQWINYQYLFSTIDNVAYGGGSKITKNITGKVGIMQGNASDLMFGLPLQSVFRSDDQNYHIPARLSVLVYSPLNRTLKIIQNNDTLKKLFQNEWVHLFCLDPILKSKFKLTKTLRWDAY